MAEMKCPRCRTELAHSTVDDLELEICFSCHGAWFDRGELREAKDMALPDGDWLDFEIWKHPERFEVNAGEVNCPRCEKRLCRLLYGDTHVEIEVCPNCHGVWLDEAELGKIVESLDNEINAKTFPEYVAAAVREAGEIVTGPESTASEWKDFKHVAGLMLRRFYLEHPGLTKALRDTQQALSFLR